MRDAMKQNPRAPWWKLTEGRKQPVIDWVGGCTIKPKSEEKGGCDKDTRNKLKVWNSPIGEKDREQVRTKLFLFSGNMKGWFEVCVH